MGISGLLGNGKKGDLDCLYVDADSTDHVDGAETVNLVSMRVPKEEVQYKIYPIASEAGMPTRGRFFRDGS